jgi:hypothetical protein
VLIFVSKAKLLPPVNNVKHPSVGASSTSLGSSISEKVRFYAMALARNRSLISLIFSSLFLQILKHGVPIFRQIFKNRTITFITPTPSVIEEMTVDPISSRTEV